MSSKARGLASLGNVYSDGQLSHKNLIINGAMQVAQRGTSFTDFGTSDAYATVDRWMFDVTSASTGRATIEQVQDGPSGFASSVKISCTATDTDIAAGERLQIQQRLEGQDLQRIGKGTSEAKPLTVSFYVKANAAFTYALELYDADNNRQITKLFNTTTQWQRVELTFPADTVGTFDNNNALSMYLIFTIHAGSTYTSGTLNSDAWAAAVSADRAAGIDSFYSSTSNYLQITGVQLEVGDTATPFEHRSYGDELARCQRYYHRVQGNASDQTELGMGYAFGTASVVISYTYPTTMRSPPTISESGVECLTAGVSFTDASLNVTVDSSIHKVAIGFGADAGAPFTANRVCRGRLVNDATAFLAFDAEL